MTDITKAGGFDTRSKYYVYIFENQRFHLTSAQWGDCYPSDRSKFSNEDGSIRTAYRNVTEIPCPDGFKWEIDGGVCSNWVVNRNYTQTDADGWSYAAKFHRLSQRLRGGNSIAAPHPHHIVRRRMWYRECSLIDPAVAQTEEALIKNRETEVFMWQAILSNLQLMTTNDY
jgi:hypothetical protein